MPGMPGPADGWVGAWASALALWVGMMAVMMLPSLAPKLWSYGQAVARAGQRPGARLIALVGLVAGGYLAVWTALGALLYPVRETLGAVTAGQPALAGAVPVLIGVLVGAAGVFQCTRWKARHLACWRACAPSADAGRGIPSGALRYGAELGVHCAGSAGGLIAVLLAVGPMDLRVMAVATAVVTLERLAPGGFHFARVLGGVCSGA